MLSCPSVRQSATASRPLCYDGLIRVGRDGHRFREACRRTGLDGRTDGSKDGWTRQLPTAVQHYLINFDRRTAGTELFALGHAGGRQGAAAGRHRERTKLQQAVLIMYCRPTSPCCHRVRCVYTCPLNECSVLLNAGNNTTTAFDPCGYYTTRTFVTFVD